MAAMSLHDDGHSAEDLALYFRTLEEFPQVAPLPWWAWADASLELTIDSARLSALVAARYHAKHRSIKAKGSTP